MLRPSRSSAVDGSGSAGSRSNRWTLESDPDAATFRTAMRRVVSGVTVVTTRHDGRAWGLTVSAFSSVCAEPPTVLVCVNSRTVTASDITRDGRFAVNLLSQDQLYLSRMCARPGDVKYVDDHSLPADELPERVAMPVLRNSLVTFECRLGEARPVGSHFVVIGTVEAVLAPPARPPLLFGEGRYLHGVSISEAPALMEALTWV